MDIDITIDEATEWYDDPATQAYLKMVEDAVRTHNVLDGVTCETLGERRGIVMGLRMALDLAVNFKKGA